MSKSIKISLFVVFFLFCLSLCGCKKKYIVEIYNSENKIVLEEKVKKGSKISQPTIPTKDGYTFLGWFNNDSKWDFSTNTVEQNLKLNEKWEVVTYNNTYDLNGGVLEKANPSNHTVEDNVTLNNPTREGYKFLGWYENDVLVTKLGCKNYNLVAKWEIEIYNIVFDSNGGSNVNSIQFSIKDNQINIIHPTKEGYKFLGWYENDVLVTKFDFKDYNLVAKWETISYNISYELDGGILENANPIKYTIEDNIILNNPTKEGYNFLGWITSILDEPVLNVNINKQTGNKYYFAVFEPIVYTITFDSNGGSYVEPIEFTVEDYTIFFEEPIYAGFEFDGWYENGVIIEYLECRNYNLVAKWKVIDYTVKFNSNGGTPVEDQEVEIGCFAEEPETPSRLGYTFAGWYDYDEIWNFTEDPIEDDIMLTAKWILNSYNITYELNEGTATNPTTYTVEDVITLNNPTKKGHLFIGWKCNESDEPVLEITLNKETGDKHFIAVFELQKYTITFDLTNCSLDIDSVEVYYDNYFDITKHVPSREGYEFVGWYIDSKKISCGNYIYTKDITVFARWDKEVFTENGKKYLYFGRYPQSLVENTELISNLSLITEENSLGYIEYNGKMYKKVVANPYWDYYTFMNGETIVSKKTYYFEVEAIKWRVLYTSGSTYTLLSELIIDNKSFYSGSYDRTINKKTVYINNYEYSNIRAWLNGYDGSGYNVTNYTNIGFIDLAFTNAEKAFIKTTNVANGVSSTGDLRNIFVCNDTQDKVFLLSGKEATNSSYGFKTSQYDDYSRSAGVTDYARSKSCYMYNSLGIWWLRSPAFVNEYDKDVKHVYTDGDIVTNADPSDSEWGVRPAINITL